MIKVFNEKYSKLIGFIVLLLVIAFAKQTSGFYQETNDSVKLLEAMNIEEQMTIKKVKFSYSGLVQQAQQLEEIIELERNVEKEFGIEMIEVEHSDHPYVEYLGSLPISSFDQLEIKLVGNQESDNRFTTFIVINKTTNSVTEQKLAEKYLKFSKSLNNIGLKQEINTSIQGEINKKMEYDEQYELLENILNRLGATLIEKLDEKLVISLSGYTDQLDRTVITNGRKMNIQVASHYNELNDVTVITIGNPVITMEY